MNRIIQQTRPQFPPQPDELAVVIKLFVVAP